MAIAEGVITNIVVKIEVTLKVKKGIMCWYVIFIKTARIISLC